MIAMAIALIGGMLGAIFIYEMDTVIHILERIATALEEKR